MRIFLYLCCMDNLDFNYFCYDCKQSREYREANCFTKYKVRKYEKGEYIAFKGDRVKELSIVVEGVINVAFTLDTGLIIRSIDHKAPTPIGGVAIFSKENRYMVDTQAVEPCTIISVDRDDITAQIHKCNDFLMSLIDYSASRVDVLAKHIAILTQRNVKSKLAYYILMQSDGKKYRFTKSIKELSEYICVERPSLSRAIANLVDDGMITYHRGSGEILNITALRGLLL